MIALGMLCFSFWLTVAKNTEAIKDIGTSQISTCLAINQERIICHNPFTYRKQIISYIPHKIFETGKERIFIL